MKPLPDHRDLTATGCVIKGGIAGEVLREGLKTRRNVRWKRNLRGSSQLTLHEAVKAFLAALQVAETPIDLQRQRLLQRSDPHQKSLESLMVQARIHLD